MPVILQDDHIDTWLDSTISDPHQLGEMLKAPPECFLDCYPVSRRVNSVRFDEPEYAERIDLDCSRLLKQDDPNVGLSTKKTERSGRNGFSEETLVTVP
jgi:SOS response associated peptidase (SRAP)